MPANWCHTTVNLTDAVSYPIRIVNHTNLLKMMGTCAMGVPRSAQVLLGY